MDVGNGGVARRSLTFAISTLGISCIRAVRCWNGPAGFRYCHAPVFPEAP